MAHSRYAEFSHHGQPLGADELRRIKAQHLVHHLLRDGPARRHRASLHHDAEHPQAAQLSKHALERDPPLPHGEAPHLDSQVFEPLSPSRRNAAAGDQYGLLGLLLGDQLGGDRRPQPAIEHDAPRVASPRQPAGQLRIIRQHGARAHQHGIDLVAQPVDILSRGRSRDPSGVSGSGGDPAVQGGRQLERDEGKPLGDVLDEGLVQAAAFLLPHRHLDPNAGLPECVYPAAGHHRIGVHHPRHHPPYAGVDERLGTRGGAAEVAARLQIDVERGAAGRVARLPERHHLRVIVAGPGMIAAPHDAAVPHRHRSHHGVRTGPAGGPARQP